MKTRAAHGVASILELMRVLQFGDSVVPVGSFSFSNGVEPAVQQGIVHDLATLQAFVATALEQAATCATGSRCSARTVRPRRGGDLQTVMRADLAVHNRKLNEEMRLMTVRMGAQARRTRVPRIRYPAGRAVAARYPGRRCPRYVSDRPGIGVCRSGARRAGCFRGAPVRPRVA